MSNDLEEFNSEYLSHFLKLIIDKESIFLSDGDKWYETFWSEHEISYYQPNKVK
ncbi:MAG: hypothetical protein ACTS73_01200 [Arsenophonus sp. NEOnobi-MAG3]